MLRSSPNRRHWPWAWLALWVLWLQAVLGAPLPEAQTQALLPAAEPDAEA